MNQLDYNIFDLGNVTLLSGKKLLNAKLAYKTYGSLNKDSSNVILLPTFYTGTHKRNEGFFGTNRAINPDKHFIISINLFGNGLSSSPTNAEKEQQGSNFPIITFPGNLGDKETLVAAWKLMESH